MKFFILLTIIISVVFTIGPVRAKTDMAAELKEAQKTLASGDYEKAYAEYIKIAQEKNNPLAQFTIGLFYQYGWGRAVESAKACGWYEKAAAGNVPAAQHFLGDCLIAGIHRSPDPAMAASWYEKAAALGYHLSLCSLAELYMTGSGVSKDPVKALMLCRQSAEKASIPAQVQMGQFLLQGDESIRNFDEAFYWFELAAQKNSAQAQYYLAVMLRDGLGRSKEPESARYFFEMAAGQGYVPAYLPTAQLYFKAPADPQTGKLSEHDLAKAYLWVSAAAKRTEDSKELSQAADMLKKIRAIMPKTWESTLDQKVAEHIAKYAASH
jgi:hypothetical protein